MFGFLKKMGCGCGHNEKKDLAKRREEAVEQDKRVREQMSEKKIDRGISDTMEASDPVAKY